MRTAMIVVALLASTAVGSARGGGGHGSSGLSGTGSGSHSRAVSGYDTAHGTHVAPHSATNPNRTQLDNYSTRGNVNPQTGRVGTRGAAY